MAYDYTVQELARNFAALKAAIEEQERRWRTAMSELHGDNRGALAEINDSIKEQSQLLLKQNGRVTKLEGVSRAIRRRIRMQDHAITMLVTKVEQMQPAATAAATQAIHDTAPSAKRNAQLTALVGGLTAGFMIGGAQVLKMIFEAVQQLLPHVKP